MRMVLFRLFSLLVVCCGALVPVRSVFAQAVPTTPKTPAKSTPGPFLFGCEFSANASPECRQLFWETGSNFARITGGGYGWALDAHRRAMADLDAHGVKVLLQLGSHYPDSRYFALKDSYFIDQTGDTGTPDRNVWAVTYNGQAWPQYSYASETFRQELAKDFTAYLDGVRSCPNIAGLLLHNEPGYFWTEGRVYDYNPQAIARFRTWLAVRHGSIEALNSRWATHYASFDVVQPPREAPPVSNIAEWLDWRRFNVALIQDFLKWEAAFARRVRPDLPRTTNLSGPLDNWYPLRLGDNYALSQGMDVACIDIYPTATYSTRFLPGFSMDMTQGVAQGRKVWVAECDVYDGSRFPGLTEEQRADMLRSEIWSYIGHGAGAVLLWTLCGEDGFKLTHGEFNARVGAVREIAHTAQMLHLGDFHKPDRTTAICVDQDAFLYYGGLKPKLEGGFMAQASAQGLYAAIVEGHREADIISADQVRGGVWKRYHTLLLATPVLMDAELAGQLRAFVAGGGLLIAESPLARCDRWGHELDVLPGFGLDRVFGFHSTVGAAVESAAKNEASAPAPISSAAGTIAATGRVPVTPEGAAVIGTFANGQPAVTQNRFGKGTAVYFAADVGGPYADGRAADSHLGTFVATILGRYAAGKPGPEVISTGSAQDESAFVDSTQLTDGRGNRLLVFVSPSERAHAVVPVSGIRIAYDADLTAHDTVFAFPPARQENGRTIAGPQILSLRPIGSHRYLLPLPTITSALPVLIARNSPPLLVIDGPMAASPGAEVTVRVTCYNPSPAPIQGTVSLALPEGWVAQSVSSRVRMVPHGEATVVLHTRVGRGTGRSVTKARLDYASGSLGQQRVPSTPIDIRVDTTARSTN